MNGLVPLRILNPQGEDIVISAGTKVADFLMIAYVVGKQIPLSGDEAHVRAMQEKQAVIPEKVQEAIESFSKDLTPAQKRSAVQLLVEFSDIVARPLGRT